MANPDPLAEEKKEEGVLDSNKMQEMTKDKADYNSTTDQGHALASSFSSLQIAMDPAYGHSTFRRSKQPSVALRMMGTTFRTLLLDVPLMLAFAAFVAAVLLHKIHDDYLYPQLELMRFIPDGRDFTDMTYYHRYCDGRDVTATSVKELVIDTNASTEDATMHMLKHGVSMYQDLLSPETASELREFILVENQKQEGFYVIENENRYSWGIDVNMHPALHKYWKELASNEQLVKALESIVGPDPAIIEFTAITVTHGAKDQHDHQDVIPPASAVKFARTFIPSYSLFIPLQDTTYDMGATHVCPGTHLCSDGCEYHCQDHSLAVSGPLGEGVWPLGWGALINSQLTHKGMGHFKEGGMDRVVLIATFAPQPQTHRGLETRMIAQGGSYSLLWTQWGHTFSDYVHADKRMTEPQRTMRSLGLIKGKGWNMVSVASMRIANEEVGYKDWDVEIFIEKGGFWFLPQSWQGEIEGESSSSIDNMWHTFLIGTLKRTEHELEQLNMYTIFAYLGALLLIDILRRAFRWSNGSVLLRSIGRLAITHGMVVFAGFLILHVIEQSNWAKDLRSRKSYRLPTIDIQENTVLPPATLPVESDVLIAPHYASDYLASYSRVLEVAHPGNRYWKDLTRQYADGYVSLSPVLQRQFCQSLVGWVEEERRFLKQNDERMWTADLTTAYLSDFCHKEIVSVSSSLKDALVRQIDSLQAEIEFGRWRDKTIQQKTMGSYLELWEQRIVPPLPASETTKGTPRSSLTIRQRIAATPSLAASVTYRRKYFLPPVPEPNEPYPGAWLEEGDAVEAKDQCQRNGEWYHGTIHGATPNDNLFDVIYENEIVDEAIDPKCIRRWVPYEVGEIVEALDNYNFYHRGRIAQIHYDSEEDDDGEFFDIQVEQGPYMEMVEHKDLRRFTPKPSLKFGDQVWARFEGGEEVFPARIVKVHGDGTYAADYEDGDYEEHVPAEFIQLQ